MATVKNRYGRLNLYRHKPVETMSEEEALENDMLNEEVWKYYVTNSSNPGMMEQLRESLPLSPDSLRLTQILLLQEISFLSSEDLDIGRILEFVEVLRESCKDSPYITSDLSRRLKPTTYFSMNDRPRGDLEGRLGSARIRNGLLLPTLQIRVALRDHGGAGNAKALQKKVSDFVKVASALVCPDLREKSKAVVMSGGAGATPGGLLTSSPFGVNAAGACEDGGNDDPFPFLPEPRWEQQRTTGHYGSQRSSAGAQRDLPVSPTNRNKYLKVQPFEVRPTGDDGRVAGRYRERPKQKTASASKQAVVLLSSSESDDDLQERPPTRPRLL